MDPWATGLVALWVLVLVLTGVVLALLRQVGLLHERIAPAGALVGGERPARGERAPVFEIEDWSGHRVRIGDRAARGTLLFFVSPTCPVCKSLLPIVRDLGVREGVDLVVASDGERAEHEAFVRAQGLERDRYVLSGPLGLAYQIARLPYAVLIDEEGVVQARGLVNQREHLESLFEARDLGVASLQEYVARARESSGGGAERKRQGVPR